MIACRYVNWLEITISVLWSNFISRQALIAENTALRSQLALFDHQIASGKRKKPKTTHTFRQLWVVLSRCFLNWKSMLIVVKPENVIGWHCAAFGLHWTRKSRSKGRPAVPRATIALIKRIHNEKSTLEPGTHS